jgi:SAM-dependent methyltransferase
VVVSQEALLHVPDKAAALREAYRLLRPGGRLCFTDWVVHRPLSKSEADTMWTGIAAQTVMSMATYRDALTSIGFTMAHVDDLTTDWGVVLEQRRRMYLTLRDETRAAGQPSGDDSFYTAYVELVALVQARVLGGARFTAVKP